MSQLVLCGELEYYTSELVIVKDHNFKMKFLIISAILISLSCLIQAEMYTSRYDNIKLDEMMGNKRLMKGYMKCTLEEGPCTAEGKELKFYIMDALKTGCSKCTDRQRHGIKKVMNHLINNEPAFWKLAVDRYDPDRVYTAKYESQVESW